MLMIKAVSFNGEAMTTQLCAEFGELGGVIGRADGNALVLPDPQRLVSRAHASIAFQAGSYVIRDMSSATPVYLNGKPLGNGRQADIQPGDELRIGAYALEVLAGPSPSTGQTPVDDPLSLFGNAASDPFASHAQKPPAQPGIPDDFDPFADLSPPDRSEPAAQSLPDDFHLGLTPASGSDINQLFGLGSSHSIPFPDGHPLAGNSAPPGFMQSSDPLVVFGAGKPAAPGPSSQRDNTPEIYGSFVPPMVSLGNEQRDAQHMFVSWNADNGMEKDGIKTMVIQSPARPLETRPTKAERPQETPVAAEPAASADAPIAGAQEDLLKAFLKGAGVPELEMGATLSPEMMTMFGRLLRESMQGTLDLLMARALTKREMHAQMTVIASRENNPLKFSPNVEVALNSLLAPRGRGFMPPLSAMKDAYDDLRAHQFGVMAGMRAALARVLYRFDPAQLEQRLTDKTLVDTLLPVNRKAKLWGQYVDLYSEITKEAEDDFQTWFGKEFLCAYEAQMAKLKRDSQQDPA